MKTLNLVSLEKSDIKYKISKFPDGQQNIVIDALSIDLFKSNNKNHIIQIKSRLNNWLDLELIIASVASLKELGVEEIHLYTPYIMGARSDRKFEEGGNNYLKDVICPIINSLNFKTVTCIDPHSDVLEACLNNFKKVCNQNLVKFALANIYCPVMINNPLFFAGTETNDRFENFILISPDAGASKKIYKIAEQIGYKGDIITCSKDRNNEGKLTKISLMNLPKEAWTKDLIIIDDICDGGATFINIAKHFKENYGDLKGKIYLIVTHGIFSKGFSELSKYFDGIYCTNSYKEVLKGSFYNYDTKDIVKQLNVF